MSIFLPRIPTALASLSLALLLHGGCAARAQVTPEEVAELRERIAELERSHGRLRVRLEDAESRTYLLQDRVEANRIALQHHQRMGSAPGDSHRGAPQTRSGPTPPSRGAGRSVPDLPVERWGPGPDPADEEAGGAEVVITQERYDATFSGQASGRSSGAPAGGGGQRQALPPVVTSGERLSVTDSTRPTASAVDALSIYQEGLQRFHEREYDSARELMRQVLQMGPPPGYTDNALYWIGECYYGVGRWEEALRYFQRVVNEHASGNKAADSMLKVALTHERMGDTQAALRALRTLVDAHPGHPSARRGAERLRELE